MDRSFSNARMMGKKKGKPHIQLIKGWWRVSPMERPRYDQSVRWQAANLHVALRNAIHWNVTP